MIFQPLVINALLLDRNRKKSTSTHFDCILRWQMCVKNGSPLSLDQQLRWMEQPSTFHGIPNIYRFGLPTCFSHTRLFIVQSVVQKPLHVLWQRTYCIFEPLWDCVLHIYVGAGVRSCYSCGNAAVLSGKTGGSPLFLV